MRDATGTLGDVDDVAAPEPAPAVHEALATDLLVEEVSIDGLCGVY